MGSTHATMKNLSYVYRDYPPGCVPCPQGNKPGNPGTFQDIHKKFDNLDPKLFDGARLIVRKGLSKHFNITHTLTMSSKNPALYKLLHEFGKEEDLQDGYMFGACYVGPKRVGYKEKYPMLYGNMTTNGNLTANFIHTLGCRLRIKFSTNIKRDIYSNSKATMEYRTDDLTFSGTVIDPSFFKQEGVLLLQFLQSITSRIALGFEIACNKTSTFPGGQQTNLAGAFRYSTGFRTLSATIGQAGVRVCYHHKQSQHLQMGVEFQSNFITHESKSRILYQLDIHQADLIFRGFVDSKWRVGAVFEKRLYPIQEASLLLSALLDHNRQNISVGIGLTIE